MDERNEQLVKTLSQVALACLASATGGVFAGFPAIAVAGAHAGLSKLLDQLDFGSHGSTCIENARAALLELREHYEERELEQAFNLALGAFQEFGLTARQFARLDFDPEKASDEIARLSGWPKLDKNSAQCSELALRSLSTFYQEYRKHKDHQNELEQAFQDTVLNRLHSIESFDQNLKELISKLSWIHLLEMPSDGIYSDSSPTTWLSPRYSMLPYQKRPEDSAFQEWLNPQPDKPVKINVVEAPGGTGKTRWLLEHCKNRDSSWRFGFLKNPDSFEVPLVYCDMLTGPQNILVIVDYAENRLAQCAKLLNAATRVLSNRKANIRFVFIARNLSDQWFDALRPKLNDRARGWLSPGLGAIVKTNLSPLSPKLDDRESLFNKSIMVFRPRLPDSHSTLEQPDLAPSYYSNPLYIQLAALSLLRGNKVAMNDSELLRDTLDHEANNWQGYGVTRIQAEQVMAVITLWQGLESGGITRIIEQWPNRDSEVCNTDSSALAKCLSELYPDSEGSKGSIAPLIPDRLGEANIIRALEQDPSSIVSVAFGPHINDEQRQFAFSVIARMPPDAFDHVRGIGELLIGILQEYRDVDFARDVSRQIPYSSINLSDLAECAERMVYEHLLSEPRENAAYKQKLSTSLNNLSLRLVTLGRREEALTMSNEAVDLYRQLAKQQPNAFLPDLAASLNNLANHLSNLGHRDDALTKANEAVVILRRLAEQKPDAFLPGLAASLNSLAANLSALGRREDALTKANEAVDSFRRLAEQQPDAFLPKLAAGLSNLSGYLSDLGRFEEALTKANDAFVIRRRLAEQQPDAFLPDLANSLNNLSNHLSDLGRFEEALTKANEGFVIRRRLAEQQPDTFLPDLASSLNNLANRLSDLGRREDALAKAKEAVVIGRRLAEQRPDALLPDLAKSLNNLSHHLSNLGRREDALAKANEAVVIDRRLAEQQPDAFLPDLARSLNKLANRLFDLGRREEALAKASEAVVIGRRLVEQQSDAFLPDLARGLSNLAGYLPDLGRRDDALTTAKEVVDLYRQLAEEQSNAFLPDLARSLNNLANSLSGFDRLKEALTMSNEAVGLYRELARQQPDVFLPNLATSLSNLANYSSYLGRHEDALTAANEVVDLYRALVEQQPDTFLSSLAMSLNNLAVCLSPLGRHEDALTKSNEAVDLYHALAEQQPDTFLPSLAMSLNNLAVRLSALGRREDALTKSNEAVDLYRRLAKQRLNAFLPDLATSLATQATIVKKDAEGVCRAMELFHEALKILLPIFLNSPEAHAELIEVLLKDYVAICTDTEFEVDAGLVEQIRDALSKMA